MAYNPISNIEVSEGAPLDGTLLLKIKNNFESQQDELAAKQLIIDSQAAIISKTVPIGTYINSDLTLSQFQSETPGIWMLANGGSCTGTAYATKTGRVNVPDLRGVYMRAKDNGRGLNPDGDLALGAYTADAIRNISGPTGVHITGGSVNLPGGYPYFWGSSGYGTVFGGVSGNNQTSGIGFDVSRQVPTAGDNRPKSVTVNVFIKVGY